MFKAVFSTPLNLTVGTQALSFTSVGDFEFALRGRVGLRGERLAKLRSLTNDGLRLEARGTERTRLTIEKALADRLTD